MTKAILIGAGFSCDLGMPLGIDVTNKFFRKLNSEELLKFKAIYDNARPYDKNRKMSEDAFQDILHIFEQYQYKENYEKFIQRIELLDKGSGDRSYIDGIRYFLGIIYEWLYGYFLEVQEKSFNLYQDMKSTYAWFEKFIDKNHETWVLSLNHDLLIEFLSKDYNIPLSMGLNKKKEFLLSNYENDKKVKFIELDRDYYDINKMNFFRNKKGINLIKLHGGLNEFSYKDNKIKNEESGQILCFADYMTDLTSLSYLDHIITINKKMKNYINGQDVKAGKELAITDINGDLEFFRKSMLTGGRKFRQTLQPEEGKTMFLMKQVLENIDELYIIGYGFNESDTHINDRIDEAMILNQKLKLHIVRPYDTKVPYCIYRHNYNNRVKEYIGYKTPEFFHYIVTGKQQHPEKYKLECCRKIKEKINDVLCAEK